MQVADLLRLLALAAIWGSSYIFMRLAAPVFGPIALVAIRVALAGIVLLAYANLAGISLRSEVHWHRYLIIGAIGSALPFGLIMWATLHITASFAAILNATSPLFSALIAAVWLGEALTVRKLLGLMLGVTGVALLVGWTPVPLTAEQLWGAGACLLGAACYGLAGVYTKIHTQGTAPMAIAIGSLLGATVVLLPVVPFALPGEVPGPEPFIYAAVLAILCTAIAYILYFRLIIDVGPVKAITVTFLIPLFAALWGVIFLGERLSAGMLLGGGIVIVGSWLVLRPSQSARRVYREARADSSD